MGRSKFRKLSRWRLCGKSLICGPTRAESPTSLQPRATPWVPYPHSLRPVRAKVKANCSPILLPLQGVGVYTLIPRALPWAENWLPFQGARFRALFIYHVRMQPPLTIPQNRAEIFLHFAPPPKDINKECHTPSIYRMFEVWHSLLYISNCLCLLVFLLLNDGIDDSHGSDVDDVTHAAFEVGEVDRLLQSHLNWADNFGIFSHRLNHLV